MADIEEMIEEGRIVSIEARIDEMQIYADECRERGWSRDDIINDLSNRTNLSRLFIENNII